MYNRTRRFLKYQIYLRRGSLILGVPVFKVARPLRTIYLTFEDL